MPEGGRTVANGYDPGVEQLQKFCIRNRDSRIIQVVDCRVQGSFCWLNPADCGIIQRIIPSAEQAQQRLLHLFRRIGNHEARRVISAPAHTAVKLLPSSRAVLQQLAPGWFMKDLQPLAGGGEAEVIVEDIHRRALAGLLHLMDRQRKQLTHRCVVGSFGHIPRQSGSSLPTVREQQHLAPLVGQMDRVMILSGNRRLSLELGLDQIEKGLVSLDAERGQLGFGKLALTMGAAGPCHDLWISSDAGV